MEGQNWRGRGKGTLLAGRGEAAQETFFPEEESHLIGRVELYTRLRRSSMKNCRSSEKISAGGIDLQTKSLSKFLTIFSKYKTQNKTVHVLF